MTLTEDLAFGIPGDQTIRETPSGYIELDEWTTDISHFNTSEGDTARNCQVILFGDHNSHYDADLFYLMASNFIQTFILRSVHSKNNQTNENCKTMILKWYKTRIILSGYKCLQLQILHHQI